MRRRAYRPEPPAPLDDRALLSGVGAPVVLPLGQLRLATERVQLTFSAFTRNFTFSQLRDDLKSDVAAIPFGREDGLGESIDRTVDGLQADYRAGSPFAVRSAERRLLATIRADVAARVRAGDVVIR